VPRDEREPFFGTVRAGFCAPRKQLRNTLAQGLRIEAAQAEAALAGAGIDASLRPALLSVDDWLRLSRAVSTLIPGVPKIPV
jgi:16S rRNA A1518/A1519 N6-dimethyltransferase RsmA/KsgA/DIM1 with predicted DNA glycosylase/AP lyase activity